MILNYLQKSQSLFAINKIACRPASMSLEHINMINIHNACMCVSVILPFKYISGAFFLK